LRDCGPEGRGFEPRRSPWLLQVKRRESPYTFWMPQQQATKET
jgi:hypothetical protein